MITFDNIRLILASSFQLEMMRKAIELDEILMYDTTINIGNFYVSMVVFKQPWFIGKPLHFVYFMVIPALRVMRRKETEFTHSRYLEF